MKQLKVHLVIILLTIIVQANSSKIIDSVREYRELKGVSSGRSSSGKSGLSAFTNKTNNCIDEEGN